MANILVDTIEPWLDDGSWRFSGPRNISAGVLVLDADANGPVSTHLYYRDPMSASTPVGKITPYQCLEFTVATTGSFRFGVNPVPDMFTSNVKLVECVLNGAQIDFFMRGTGPAGFDGSLSVPTTTMKLRMVMHDAVGSDASRVRYVLCSATGTVVADSEWLSAATLSVPGYMEQRGSYGGGYVQIDPVGWGGYGGLTNPAHAVGVLYNTMATQTTIKSAMAQPAFVSLTGVTTIQPYLSIVNCDTTDVTTFLAGGASALTTIAPVPANPTITVTSYNPGSHLVVVSTTTPDSALWATVDEGAYGVDAVSIATNKRVRASASGSSLSFTVADPSVVRAVAFNGKLSGVVTQYVGPATTVPVPEISPRSGSIIPGTATPVHIHCADAMAMLRYTTDGTDPTSGSAVYTGPLFLRDVTRLKVAAFNGGDTSLVKNAFFWLTTPTSATTDPPLSIENDIGIPWEPIPDLNKAASWSWNGNATFDEGAGSILVNDPTGAGVAVRTDLFPYSNGSVSIVRFYITAGMQLKVPGQELYIVRSGNYVGIVTTPAGVPTLNIGTPARVQVNLEMLRVGNQVRIAYIEFINLDGSGVPTGSVKRLADVALYEDHYPTVDAAWSTPIPAFLNFTSISVSSYTVYGIEAMVTKELAPAGVFDALNYTAAASVRSSAYPWVYPQRAVFVTPNGSNFAGVSISAGVSDASVVTMAVASAAGETHYPATFAVVPATGHTPLATDAVTRIQFLAFTQRNGITRISAVSGRGSRPASEVGEWDITRDCSDNEFTSITGPLLYATPVEFRRDSPGWASGLQLALPQASLRAFHDTVFTYPFQDLDTGSAWFRTRFDPSFSIAKLEIYTYETRADRLCDSYLTCGWDVDRSLYADVAKVVTVDTGAACSVRSDLRPEASAYAYLQTFNTATWTATNGSTKIPVSSSEKHVWYCGRKVSSGHLFVRTVVLPQTDLTTVLFDTGWIDTGVTPAILPRPRIIYRTRRSPQGSLRGEHTGKSFVRGWQSLTDPQLENCFSYGTPTPLPMPAITDSAGTGADISTYPPDAIPENGSNMVPMAWDPAANGGAKALYVHAGSSVLRRRKSLETIPNNEGLLTAAGTVLMSTMSTVSAVNLGDPITETTKNIFGTLQPEQTSWDSTSPVQIYNFTHQTTDYISVQSTLPRHVILQFNKAATLPVTDGTAYWKIVFSDGYEQTVTSLLTDDVERVLDAGSYTVKFVRVALNANNTSDVGETIPAAFTVADHISLTMTTPTTVSLNTPTAFQAATTTTGVSYRWEFSDGFVAETATVSRTMTKAGRYTWSLVVVDDLGDSAQAEGKFVVPWTSGTLTPPTALTIGTTGVKIS